ncbi:MAG: hypothetical protein QOK43_2999 [Acidimicrobiaceae bacterium]|nr:hypothetical protein [Acidimicrobiaceae bacterium]
MRISPGIAVPPGSPINTYFNITQSAGCPFGAFTAYGGSSGGSCLLTSGNGTTNNGAGFHFDAVGSVFVAVRDANGNLDDFQAVGILAPDPTRGGDCLDSTEDFLITWVAIDTIHMPQSGAGGPGAVSGSCTVGQLSEGYLGGIYHRLYSEQAAPGTNWVCFRIDAGGGDSVGGRVVVQSVSGGAPRTDTNAAACATGWNGLGGPHPLASGTTGGVSYLLDTYSGGGEVWLCFAVGGSGTRVVIPTGPGPGISWDFD